MLPTLLKGSVGADASSLSHQISTHHDHVICFCDFFVIFAHWSFKSPVKHQCSVSRIEQSNEVSAPTVSSPIPIITLRRTVPCLLARAIAHRLGFPLQRSLFQFLAMYILLIIPSSLIIHNISSSATAKCSGHQQQSSSFPQHYSR